MISFISDSPLKDRCDGGGGGAGAE